MRSVRRLKATDEEKNNGWTDEAITKYVAERDSIMFDNLFPERRRIEIDSNFDPKKW
jgi:hypothetical protein